jgi:hypothetical protein
MKLIMMSAFIFPVDTALSLAVWKNRTETCELLMSYGAKVLIAILLRLFAGPVQSPFISLCLVFSPPLFPLLLL